MRLAAGRTALHDRDEGKRCKIYKTVFGGAPCFVPHKSRARCMAFCDGYKIARVESH